MRLPASTDKEILLRELNETEEVLAEASQVLGCTCIIDPTETLGDRVRHLAMMAILMQASIGQLRKIEAAKREALLPENYTMRQLLEKLGDI